MAAQIVQNHNAQNQSGQNEERQVTGDGQAALRNRVDELTASRGGEPAHSARPSRTSERTPAGREQNPELLQWRANVLLDEMMLGAVDIAASDVVSAPTRPPRNGHGGDAEPAETGNHSAPRREDPQPASHPTSYANGRHQEPHQTAATDERAEPVAPTDPQDVWSRPSWHFAEPTVAATQAPSMTPSARAAVLQEHTRHHQTPPPTTSPRPSNQSATPELRTTAVGALAPRPTPSAPATAPTRASAAPGKPETGKKEAESWVFAAEQRYQQIAARHQPTAPAHAADPAAAWVDPVDALFDEFAGNGYGAGTAARGGRQRVTQNPRRSNLLPRMSTLDPRALQQEMVLLQTEIEQALPAGHESRERALHLLQKAYTILHADPSRSAEVDYYLQQVRTIGQRVQETLRWSNLYHSRLNSYLAAWTALSLIVLTARYAYQTGLANTIGYLLGVEPAFSLVPHNVLTLFTAFFGGALGGALGAFINMHQYAQIKQGFFDRKYSLRGLILPLIGGIVGLVLCLFFGIFYYLFGVDPALNLLLGALPALLAFGFGIAQEFIYGTRS